MKISKEKREELILWLMADLDAAERHYQDVIQPALIKRWRQWQSDKSLYEEMFPNLSKRCSFVMSDVMDTILWILPSLMRIFFGGEAVVTLTGRTEEDDPAAMQALISWQIERQNRGFLVFRRWFVDALWAGMGVMKVRWERVEEEVEATEILPAEALLALDEKKHGMTILEANEQPDGQFEIKATQNQVTKNQPVLDLVPLSEFRFLPNSATVKDLPFCAHKRAMSRSDIQEKVDAKTWDMPSDEALAAARYQANEDSELQNLLINELSFNEGASGFDPSRELYWVEECYARYDINDDDRAEFLILTKIGNELVQIEENELERPWFSILSPIPDQYQITGKGMGDLVGEIQDIKTALIKQIILNIGNNNDRQAVIDEDKLNKDDLRLNRKYIRARNLNGQPVGDAVSYMPEAPLSAGALPLMDLMQDTAETRTGVTKYSQGLDRRGLNDTATGIQTITNSANQRTEMIARMFAETGVYDLADILLELNNRYMDTEQVVRLTNGKTLQVRPDDLKGRLDIDIGAGISAGNQEQMVNQMNSLIAQIFPTLAKLGLPPTLENVYAAAAKLLAAMGQKNAAQFLPDPAQIRAAQDQMLQAQAMAAAVGAGGGQPIAAPMPPGGLA